MVKLTLIIIVLTHLLVPCFAQETSRVDSLLYEQETTDDTAKIDALIALSSKGKDLQVLHGYATEAVELSNNIGDKAREQSAVFILGYIEERMGDYERAISNYKRSAELAIELDLPRQLQKTYQYRGDVMCSLKEWEEGISWYRKMLEVCKARDTAKLDDAYNSLGTCFKDKGELDSALYYHEKALRIRLGNGDDRMTSYSYNNIGLVYKKQGAFDMAIDYLKRSLEIKTRLQDVRGMASSNINIGNILIMQSKFDQALYHLEKGIAYADSVDAAWFLINGYDAAVRAYLYKNNKQMADHYTNLVMLEDSLNNENAIAQARDIEAKYKLEEKEKLFKVEKEKAALERQKIQERNKLLTNQVYLAVGGLLVLCALIILVVRASRHRRKSNELLSEQKAEIEQKNLDITDSINYAKKIQDAMLPGDREMEENLKDHFVLYRPKDIVSGDFYWVSARGGYTIVAVGDCTGHGVPGAFMSMMGHSFLNQVVNDQETSSPAQALTLINEKVISSYRKETDRSSFDGMDIALCAINWQELEVEYAGALRPLWILRDDEIIVIKGSKRAIGSPEGEDFSNSKFKLQPGDQLYMFSDGYPDQFGGRNGKKLKTSGFKKLLVSLKGMSGSQQKYELEQFLDSWQADFDQLDDICVIGIRV